MPKRKVKVLSFGAPSRPPTFDLATLDWPERQRAREGSSSGRPRQIDVPQRHRKRLFFQTPIALFISGNKLASANPVAWDLPKTARSEILAGTNGPQLLKAQLCA
jgi:hypothetical protein